LLLLLLCELHDDVAVLGVRLAGSGLEREGRLEMEISGVWGTVCDDEFADDDAAVACRMLGLGYVSVM